MSKSPGIVSFVESFDSSPVRQLNYDPSRKYPPPVTDDEIRAREAFLVADNRRLRAEIAHREKALGKYSNAEATAAAAVEFQEGEAKAGRTISATDAVAHVTRGARVPFDNRALSFQEQIARTEKN